MNCDSRTHLNRSKGDLSSANKATTNKSNGTSVLQNNRPEANTHEQLQALADIRPAALQFLKTQDAINVGGPVNNSFITLNKEKPNNINHTQTVSENTAPIQKTGDETCAWLSENGIVIAKIVGTMITLVIGGLLWHISKSKVEKVRNDTTGADVQGELKKNATKKEGEDDSQKKEEKQPSRSDSKKANQAIIKAQKQAQQSGQARRAALIKEITQVTPVWKEKNDAFRRSLKDGKISHTIDTGYRTEELLELNKIIAETEVSTNGSTDELQEGLEAMQMLIGILDNVEELADEIYTEANERLEEAFAAYDENKLPKQKKSGKPEVQGLYVKGIAENFGIPGLRREIQGHYQKCLSDAKHQASSARKEELGARIKARREEEAKNRKPVTLTDINRKAPRPKTPPYIARWNSLKKHFIEKNGKVVVHNSNSTTIELDPSQYVGPTEDESRNDIPCFNFGHLPSMENRRFVRALGCGYINGAGYIKSQLYPKIYRMETVAFNTGGAGEDPGDEITIELYTFLNQIDAWKGPHIGE